MRVSVYGAILFAGLLAGCSPWLATRQSPRLAAKLLAGSALAAGLSTWWGLVLLASTVLGRDRDIAEHGHVSAILWRAIDPVPTVLAVIGLAASALVTYRAILVIRGHISSRRHAAHVCRDARAELVVLDLAEPLGYAVPGRRPHIIASTGMLRQLTGPQRRAFLAHERSHLRHRHNLYLLAGNIAAALNPLLTRHRDDIGYTCERWADEDAAEHIQDRTTVAHALAQASLATLRERSPQLAFDRLRVRHRLAALAVPCPPTKPITALGYSVLALLPVFAICDATIALLRIVEAARR